MELKGIVPEKVEIFSNWKEFFFRNDVMSHELVYYGNSTLKCVAEEIKNIDGKVAELAASMLEVMHRACGVGLAAPQVDVSQRLIVFDYENYNGPVKALVNPCIREFSASKVPYDEGCLSIPGISREIVRPSGLLVSGVTLDGKEVEFEAYGLTARILQHEIDHLNGIVFIDYLEDYVRKELIPQLKKIKKMNKKQ